MRICIVSESIKRPFDEGVKNFVRNLIKEFSKDHVVLALSHSNDFGEEIEAYCTKALPDNRLLISSFLRRKIKTFNPDVIYYIPTACATFFSFFRTKILKLYGNGAKTVMITLQPRDYSAISRMIIPFILPDLILVQSLKTKEILSKLGCKIGLIPVGVNLQRFTPISNKAKANLRKKYGFPANKFIILHVGHVNRNRNMQFMEKVQCIADDAQAVVVGSTSYPEDVDLVKELEEKGVIVMTNYIEKIEELYQCADCYLFPVVSDSSCIEIPLSVFEAMACNLPVVATKFGGMPHLINEQDGFIYADTLDEIVSKVNLAKVIPFSRTRKIAELYSWESVAKKVLRESEI